MNCWKKNKKFLLVVICLFENLCAWNKVAPEPQILENNQFQALSSINPDQISTTSFHFKQYLHDCEIFIWSNNCKKNCSEKFYLQDQINKARSRAAIYGISFFGSTKERRQKALEKLLQNLKNL
ncbi:MAG: hypothetical protein ACXWL2_04705 [Candidatus Chromulinivorax sp.]